MLGTKKTRSKQLPGNHRRTSLIVTALCAAAAFRIAFFSAAFPVFNNVDEIAHFDLIYKYAHGWKPRLGAERYDKEADVVRAFYGSREYLGSAGRAYPALDVPARHTFSPEAIEKMLGHMRRPLSQQPNHEAVSPPVYYILAGLWYRLGGALGLRDANLVYWPRLLNIPLYVALMLIAWRYCALLYPGDSYIQTAMLVFLASFPQDVFYSMNADVLSPVVCSVGLLGGFMTYQKDRSVTFAAGVGLTAALAVLTKLSNLALLPSVALLILLRLRKDVRAGVAGHGIARSAAFSGALLIPIILWMARNYWLLNDATGSRHTFVWSGWALRPWWDILNHPILTPYGFWYFLSRTLQTFWTGEIVWHSQRIHWAPLDLFCVLSSLTFIIVAVLVAWCHCAKRAVSDNASLPVAGVSALTIASFMGFLAAISLPIDFRNFWYPSREYPYFTSGRLILGALLPFAALYLCGLREVWRKCRIPASPLWAVAALAVTITLVELVLSAGVLYSNFNWFHVFMR